MIVINQTKAIEVVKGKIRAWRDGEFKKNDIAIQNALVDGSDTAELPIVVTKTNTGDCGAYIH